MKVVLLFIFSLGCLSCDHVKTKEVLDEEFGTSKIVTSIDYSYEGCFGGEAYKLTILDRNGEKFATLTANKKIISSVSFDSSRNKAYDQFLTELKEKQFNSFCTTTAYYTVTIGDDKFKKIDGSCQWNGFNRLRSSLFKE